MPWPLFNRERRQSAPLAPPPPAPPSIPLAPHAAVQRHFQDSGPPRQRLQPFIPMHSGVTGSLDMEVLQDEWDDDIPDETPRIDPVEALRQETQKVIVRETALMEMQACLGAAYDTLHRVLKIFDERLILPNLEEKALYSEVEIRTREIAGLLDVPPRLYPGGGALSNTVSGIHGSTPH